MKLENVLVQNPRLKKKKTYFDNPKALKSFPLISSQFNSFSETSFNPLFNNSNNFNSDKFNLKPSNSYSLSFEGFLHKEPIKIASNQVNHAINLLGENLGSTAKEHFVAQFEKLKSKAPHLIQIDEKTGEHVFAEKSVAKMLWENALYPIVQMPMDIINHFAKNNNIPFLKNRREFNEMEAIQNSVKGYLNDFGKEEYSKNPEKLFKNANNFLNTSNGNYSVPAERSLVRLVTGALTAVFLGTDAYNLTRLVNDDKKAAKKERNNRIIQEFGRLGLTVYLTMLTQGALEKYINRSKLLGGLSIGGTVLVAETVGRLLSGVPILPVSKKKAQKLAAKEGIKFDNAVEDNKQAAKKKKQNAFSKTIQYTTLFIAAAVLGSVIKKTYNIPGLNQVFESIKKFRNALNKTEVTIEKTELDKIFASLEKNGFEKYANDLKNNINNYNAGTGKDVSNAINQNSSVISEANGLQNKAEIVKLGEDDRKIVKNIIEDVLLVPYKITKNVLFLPYNTLKFIGQSVGLLEKPMKKAKSKGISTERNAVLYLKENLNKPDFKEKVQERIFNSHDTNQRKDYDTHELSFIYKLFSSLATSVFLIFDNYNLVMKRTNGEDKELATQQAQQRTVQRGAQVIYSSYLVKLSTDLFKSFYNRSLGAVMVICGFNQLSQDYFQRASVGLPMTESTRDEILAKEAKLKNADGFKGKYFRFMSYISGKKQLSEKIKPNADTSKMVTAFEASKRPHKNMKEFLGYSK